MIMITGVGVISAGTGSIVMDAGYIMTRIANMLRRSDLDAEILHWITFAQRDLGKAVNFASLRTTGADIALTTADFLYNLPANFSKPDRFFYRNTTDAANIWGRNLVPLPRKFYAGDVVDLERLLNVSVPSTGDPFYYWIEGARVGVFPMLATGLTGVVQPTYYKLPTDILLSTDALTVPTEYVPTLIWLGYYWGAALLEKDDIGKVSYWKNAYRKALDDVKVGVRRSEVARETIEQPDNDMGSADGIN